MTEKSLFREDAVDAKKNQWMGDVVLIRPYSFSVLIGISVLFTVIILAYFFFGSYTKRITVAGQLLPAEGFAKIYPPAFGTIVEKMVSEGDHIKNGSVLYVISTEKYSSEGSVNDALNELINARRLALQAEKIKVENIQNNEHQTISLRIQSLKNNIDELASSIQHQTEMIALSEKNYARYKNLKEKDYISSEELQRKEEVLLEQKLRMETYNRDYLRTKMELDEQQNALKSLASKTVTELSQYERQISSTRQEMLENKANKNLVVRANMNGIATSVAGEVGQQVNGSKALLNIIPEHTELMANLYLPSQAIGFVKPGDEVLMRYKAFSYQKFGQAKGKVVSISETALSAQETSAIGDPVAALTQQGVPIYLVKVKLEQQSMPVYGKSQPLKIGMALDADIMQEKRKLYQWAIDPLYSLSNKT